MGDISSNFMLQLDLKHKLLCAFWRVISWDKSSNVEAFVEIVGGKSQSARQNRICHWCFVHVSLQYIEQLLYKLTYPSFRRSKYNFKPLWQEKLIPRCTPFTCPIFQHWYVRLFGINTFSGELFRGKTPCDILRFKREAKI